MGIQNFPAALQPVIQQNFLEREFQEGLRSKLAYRAVADREIFPAAIGETLTKTRRGLKAPVTVPLNPSGNTNLDNGLSPSGWAIEQYTLGVNMWGDTIDLNMVTSRVGIARQFLKNALTNGIQAAQTVDRLARNALYAAYLGGNTRVTTTLGSAGTAIHVDDITGFQFVCSNGVMVPVSGSATLAVAVGADVYTLVGAVADGSNVSTAPTGVSGTLTFSGNVSTSDGTAGNAVVAGVAPALLRPNGRKSTAALQAGDTLTMANVLDAVTQLHNNNVPPVEASGLYHMYLDPQQLRGLFNDADFKLLFRGEYNSAEYKTGTVIDLLGVRFIPTTEAPQQSLGGLAIRRGIVLGQGALVEGCYEATGYSDIGDSIGLKAMVDDVCMVTREPLDRLQQIIAQSWYYIGGFVVPTDVTATTAIIPTASNSYYKRGVVIESV